MAVASEPYAPSVLVSTEGLPEKEWLEYRRRGIGGSDAAAILGISPFATARDLFYDKLKIVPFDDSESNWVAKKMGHLLEDLVAEIFHVKTGYRIYQIKKMFYHPVHTFMLADIDYFVELPKGRTAILEIKTTNYNAKDHWWSEDGQEIVPLNYEAQGRHYSVSMVFYAVDADVHGEYRKAIRRYRQMFFYKDGTLYQSRLYPADTGNALEVSKLFRHLVQKAISRCLTEPNLWYLKTKRSDLDAHYSTRRGSLHYPDYNFHGNLSILQGHKKDTVLPIGAAALCVCCGNELWSNGDIKCSCKEVVVCRKCGQTVARGQGIYLEDGFYCKTCLHICEACGRPTLGTMYPAYDRRGSLLQICHDCYQQLTASCTSCSMAAACRTMGFTICKKATIPVVA